MAQKAGGLGRVQNADTEVNHVYELYLESVSGTFVDGENLTWTGGTGVLVDHDPSNDRVTVRRSTGASPATIGLTLTGAAAATGDVSSLGDHEPPAWDTKIPDPSLNTVVLHVEGDATYDAQVASVDSADQLTLSANWPGSDADEAIISVSADYTAALNLGLYDPGESSLAQKHTRDNQEIEKRLRLRVCTAYLAADQSTVGGTPIYLGDTANDLTHAASGIAGEEDWVSGGDKMVIPAGVTAIEVAAGVRLTGTGDFNIEVHVNGAATHWSGMASCSNTNAIAAVALRTGVIAVTAGDEIQLSVVSDSNEVIDALVGSTVASWFQARVVEVA